MIDDTPDSPIEPQPPEPPAVAEIRPEVPHPAMPADAVRLLILYDEKTSRVYVDAPYARRGLCYQMLELARDMVFKNHMVTEAQREAQAFAAAMEHGPRIVRPTGPLPSRPR